MLAVTVAPRLIVTPVPAAEDARAGVGAVDWRRFESTDIAALVRAGQVVLVDVTADWCLTCQVNKTLVLARGEVSQRLVSGAVAAVRADWTLPSEAIQRYLSSFGRYGIPFNAVYGPGAPAGIALPELLSTEVVLAAFERAGAGAPARQAVSRER